MAAARIPTSKKAAGIACRRRISNVRGRKADGPSSKVNATQRSREIKGSATAPPSVRREAAPPSVRREAAPPSVRREAAPPSGRSRSMPPEP
ncbi:hypothetical protein Acsp02_05470 [Actinoplanes sp. NBRC 103695]|nr:hypothetical protein Acsp02_05470 [Actinoplanes sp. NBRC 103695]